MPAPSSLKTASEIAKSLKGLRDTALLERKVAELNREILAAQQSALSANVDQFALLQKVRELEEEIARSKQWDAEKQKYELKDVYIGSTAYVLKPGAASGEPPHWLCAACYQRNRKFILQPHEAPLRRIAWPRLQD